MCAADEEAALPPPRARTHGRRGSAKLSPERAPALVPLRRESLWLLKQLARPPAMEGASSTAIALAQVSQRTWAKAPLGRSTPQVRAGDCAHAHVHHAAQRAPARC